MTPAKLAVWPALVAVALGSVGCEAEVITGPLPVDPDEPPPEELPPAGLVDKVDLLLVVDGSIAMAHKQAVLVPSVRRLINSLVNPACVDGQGAPLGEVDQPADGLSPCPPGATRVHAPVFDLHVGVISSSLGDLGSGACASAALSYPNDQGHLVARTPGGGQAATYAQRGFLKWDTLGAGSPPGDADLAAFFDKLDSLVLGVDELGCGYEMPLEATYRFLVDPEPYEALVEQDGLLVESGVDQAILEQRAAFVRPDSFLGIVLLSDEDDCSLDPMTQAQLLLGAPFYRGTSACAEDPNDACCTSCGLAMPEGCGPDPACDQPLYGPASDHPNLKCWDQKRRYGVEFRYPTARYVNALSAPTIDPTSASLEVSATSVDNPLFAGGRRPEHVALATIVGVPWQDLVTDAANPASELKTTAAMEADGTWAWLVGASPLDPFMVASFEPRTGTSPATGEPVSGANSINGGDRLIDVGDLQYTCTFGLTQPIQNGYECQDCLDASCTDPLCAGALQVAGKAYPGQRQLEVVRGLGDRGVAGSICPSVQSGAEQGPSRLSAVSDYDKPLRALARQAGKVLRR